MEGELGAEIDFVSDNADHNQITIGYNTSCNRGGGVMIVCTPAVMQGDKIHRCKRVTADGSKGVLRPWLFFGNDAVI